VIRRWLPGRSNWAALEVELAAWQAAGVQPCLWWRDDDAVADSPALARLLALAHRHRAPLALAVIPAALDQSLAAALRRQGETVVVYQHGVDHIDRISGLARGEFPADMPSAALAGRLREGWDMLGQLLPAVVPVIVPPWNNVQPNLLAAARAAGYVGVSAYGRGGHMAAGLRRIDTQIDVLTWRGGPRFKGESRLLRQLIAELRIRRRRGRFLDPVGILTHHRDMEDAETWDFLEILLTRTVGAAAWIEPWSPASGRWRIAAAPAHSLDSEIVFQPAWGRSGGALLEG